METLNYCRFRVVAESMIPGGYNVVIAEAWSHELALQIKNGQQERFCWIEEKINGKWVKCAIEKQNK